MTKLTEPLARNIPLAGATGGRQDAYMRLLNWEATMTHRRGKHRLERYKEQYLYYSGDNMPPGQYILPLSINYLRAACEAHASYLWGQWEPQGHLVSWTVKPRAGKGDQALVKLLTDWIYELFDGHEELFYSAGLNQSIYGDCIFRPRWNPILECVSPESILPEHFHARWSAHDVSDMHEVVISYPISREEAFDEFGTYGNAAYSLAAQGQARAYAIYWEYHTADKIERWVDDINVGTDPNPLKIDPELPGIMPFVHIPNVRIGGDFYGQSDIEAVLALQDELNRKMADNGDIIAYSAHPIILVRKYFGKVEALPIGPDAIWDMGREGEAEYLSGGKPPVDIEAYLERVTHIFQDLSYMPAAAFGRSETAQASALALAMEMMPVTQRVNWKRLHWRQGLINYIHLAARVAEKHHTLPFTRSVLNKYLILPNFAPVLPKDRASSILEAVSLVSGGIWTIERALEELGETDPAGLAAAVMAQVKEKVAMGAIKPITIGGANGGGSGGSPDTGAMQRDAAK